MGIPRQSLIPDAVWESVFVPRGITRYMAETRPYVAYERGDWDKILALDPRLGQETGDEKLDRGLGFLKRAVSQQSGLAIVRHSFLGGLEEPLIQLRPDRPLVTGWRCLGLGQCQRHHMHTTTKSGPRETKYVFPPGPDRAKRIDVHPRGREWWCNSPFFFFVLEGCLKADAIMSADFPTISVPSVTLWDGPDFELLLTKFFALEKYRPRYERRVAFVVSDSDWRDGKGRASICKQSRKVVDMLRRNWARAFWVAPPSVPGEPKVGVDDHLGRLGRTIPELEIVSPQVSPQDGRRIRSWFSGRRGRGRAEEGQQRDYAVLMWLRANCSPDGLAEAFATEIARNLHMSDDRVGRGLRSLVDRGLVKKKRKPEAWCDLQNGVWKNTPTEWQILQRELIPEFPTEPLGPWLPLGPWPGAT